MLAQQGPKLGFGSAMAPLIGAMAPGPLSRVSIGKTRMMELTADEKA